MVGNGAGGRERGRWWGIGQVVGNRAGGGERDRSWGTGQVVGNGAGVGNRAGGKERHMVGRALDMWFLPSGSSESSLKTKRIEERGASLEKARERCFRAEDQEMRVGH